MPTLNVTTKAAEKVWESPDGQRKIYKLTLDYEGKPVSAQTFSNEIATEGWTGEVETYEREGKAGRPSQTFVRQLPKENAGYGGTSKGSTGSSYQPKDEKAIKAMWSIGQAVTLTTLSKTEGDDRLSLVESAAQELFAMVDRVKASENAPEAVTEPVAEPAEPETEPLPLDEVSPVSNEEMAKINEIFDKKKKE